MLVGTATMKQKWELLFNSETSNHLGHTFNFDFHNNSTNTCFNLELKED